MSEKIKLTEEQVELIEEYVSIMERGGLQPAMAKVVALLTVADDVELTFVQIQKTLGLSKSGTSQAINQLLATKNIEYKTKLGERKRYFYIPIQNWKAIARERFEGIENFIKLNRKILSMRNQKSKEFNDALKEMTEFLSSVQEVLATKFK